MALKKVRFTLQKKTFYNAIYILLQTKTNPFATVSKFIYYACVHYVSSWQNSISVVYRNHRPEYEGLRSAYSNARKNCALSSGWETFTNKHVGKKPDMNIVGLTASRFAIRKCDVIISLPRNRRILPHFRRISCDSPDRESCCR